MASLALLRGRMSVMDTTNKIVGLQGGSAKVRPTYIFAGSILMRRQISMIFLAYVNCIQQEVVSASPPCSLVV